MKRILTIITASIVLSFTVAEAIGGNRKCRPFEYWERQAYREGFLDGYEGIHRNIYIIEMDRIAYDIGFLDGDMAFDMKQRTWKEFDFEKLM
jgi:hypothetical protein